MPSGSQKNSVFEIPFLQKLPMSVKPIGDIRLTLDRLVAIICIRRGVSQIKITGLDHAPIFWVQYSRALLPPSKSMYISDDADDVDGPGSRSFK